MQSRRKSDQISMVTKLLTVNYDGRDKHLDSVWIWMIGSLVVNSYGFVVMRVPALGWSAVNE